LFRLSLGNFDFPKKDLKLKNSIMLNFELYNPTNLIFGKGQIEKLTTLVPQGAKILLAYGGGSIFKNGVHEQVRKSLEGFEVIEFGGIEPNPHFETVMKAVAIIKEKKINFILAVGGGSVIDGVKFMSAAAHFEGNPIDILKKRILLKDVSKVVPFGTVLTLPATGSEMNSGSVITIEATQEKLAFGGSAMFPIFSICDPMVIASLPKRN
jgi:NADP-dependent alcohol dehydrogenase